MTSERRSENQGQRAVSRRNFMKGAAAAAGALATGGAATSGPFTFVPHQVLGGPRLVSPNEKLNLVFIGSGGRGKDNINALRRDNNVVALCDVDDAQAAEMYKEFPDVPKYRDYRVMLDKEDKNIDGVVISIPDHGHAAAAMRAIRMGKHVYCEKPLTHTVHEARTLAEAAREAGVATQMGNNGQASEETRLVSEYVWDGAIGPVREVHIWTNRAVWPQGIDRPADTPDPPATLDWDLWLGPAPDRPFHPGYLPFNWRGWLDFGTGALGDMGCHFLDPVFRALQLKHPTSVQARFSTFAEGWDKWKNTETYPRASVVHFKFPERGDMPPVDLIWYDGGLLPLRPDELEKNRKLEPNGRILVGDKGKILGKRLIPESKMREYKRPAKTIERSPGHYKEWTNACKGGKPAGSNFDFASIVTETVLLGNLGIRTGGARLEWDGPNMKITNNEEANELLHSPYREGWAL